MHPVKYSLQILPAPWDVRLTAFRQNWAYCMSLRVIVNKSRSLIIFFECVIVLIFVRPGVSS